MVLTLNEMMAAIASYDKIDKTKFNLKTTYKLARLFKNISEEAKCYEDSVKQTVLKYAEKDENGEPIISQEEQGESVSFLPGEQQKCLEEIDELGKETIEIKDCYFTLDELGDVNISIDEMKGLLPFIKEEE